METTGERQQLEIIALKSIYPDVFSEPPAPKAWKDATRLPEFIIKVAHSDEKYASKIFCHLHTKFPKTYPNIACPAFTIQKPILGLTNQQINELSSAVRAEALKHRGSEMVLQIVVFCQEWITSNAVLPIETHSSLAKEMQLRAQDQEREKKAREVAEAEQKQEREARLAEELEKQILADAQKHRIEKEKQFRARHRANSEATEVPSIVDTMTESFQQEIVYSDLRFSTVRCFHRRQDGLGTTYLAEPVCDDSNATVPLEVHVVQFDSEYYSTNQGMKKLKSVENDIQNLIKIRHPNLLSLLAVKLIARLAEEPPRLVILSEQQPTITLHDVLEDCEALREQRAFDYATQLLSALNVVHTNGFVHKGINTRCIGLGNRDTATQTRTLKLCRVSYHKSILDLHRSNAFSNKQAVSNGDTPLPDSWLSIDVIDSPLKYTRSRDIHDVGVAFLQMLFGLDVAERYPDPHAVFRSPSGAVGLVRIATNMLAVGKRNQMSCSGVLAALASHTAQPDPPRSAGMHITNIEPRTPLPANISTSPEIDFFRPASTWRRSTRWKEEWEELELLGKGAFGSVVKARNKLDSTVYAVKKIPLRVTQSDSRIYREVTALSRLKHHFIVRYCTTWVEISEDTPPASPGNSDDTSGSFTPEALTAVTPKRNRSSDRISFDLADLDSMGSGSHSSFPSIHFSGTSTPKTDEEDDSGEAIDDLFALDTPRRPETPPRISHTLFIQMEFVERQTLKERVAEGLSEDDAWRLFHQIVEALVYMSSLGILHRDIKLTNIFIDVNGDCKVGDFGLATSSLVAVDTSNAPSHALMHTGDMTLAVGTRLYIAPEVLSRKRGLRNHSKADMYSLGIVFFEMNFPFSTESERIAVIDDLRKPSIIFPPTWDSSRTRQHQIITWLLQHDPADRPSAVELSQSPLLPSRIEDEYFKKALKMMSRLDSPHHQVVLSTLFSQAPTASRFHLYDSDIELLESAQLNGIVQERLIAIFRLHGAVDMEPPLLIPAMQLDEEKNQVVLLDRHGDLVTLPSNGLAPFARLAARSSIRRIKRYHLTNIYRPTITPGQPKSSKVAVLDIISPDLTHGPIAAGAEILSLINECLISFPTLAQAYEIHISHSDIVDAALNRVPDQLRPAVLDIMSQFKSSPSQKRALLLKKNVPRSVVDELELLADADVDVDEFLQKLERVSPTLLAAINSAIEQMKMIIQHAKFIGITQRVLFHPLMLASHHVYFKGGIRFEVVRRNKWTDILAAGGEYTNLIARHAHPKAQADSISALGIQIHVDKIASVLASFQSSSVKALIKEQRSFGFWSPRRCDVYVVSYHSGYLQDRLEVVGYLWQHNISADLVYESAVSDVENENHIDVCEREGILFIVYPRPRAARRDQAAFKIKSVLKGTEYEVSRPELVGWLQHEIAEQKRVDASTSGVTSYSDIQQSSRTKDVPGTADVQLFLPVDVKKQRKLTKQLFLDRAFEAGSQVKATFQSGMPIFAVDVPPNIFDALVRTSTWVTDDDAWRSILAGYPTANNAYLHQLREAAAKRKGYILLYALKEERVQLLAL